MLRKVIKTINKISTSSEKLFLGRWNIAYGKPTMIKQTFANHDHCGCCGTPDMVSYKNILEKESFKKESLKKDNQ